MEDNNCSEVSVLVVDDDPLICRAHQRFLEQMGCVVTVANNGKQALSMLNQRCQLIFIDVNMPILNGIETTTEIRRRETNGAKFSIIGITANSDTETIQACLTAGMNEVINKPICSDKFKELINKWVTR